MGQITALSVYACDPDPLVAASMDVGSAGAPQEREVMQELMSESQD